MDTRRFLAAIAASLGLALSVPVHSAATIAIFNGDGAGEGFNDPTPTAPVGGNPGLTLGQQRINAFVYAASIWGANLDSSVQVNVLARMDPLTCNATSAVLGSAGPTFVNRDFAGAVPGYWYHIALSNKLEGADAVPGFAHISARFNSRLGQPGCLTGSGFYLGLDGNHGTQIDLVTVLLHEFGHGLGFSTTTNGTTGAFSADSDGGFPSIYDRFTFDNTAGKAWDQMTNAERVASAVNARNVVWTGANVTAAAPSVLARGTPQLEIKGSGSADGIYAVGIAAFGPSLADRKVNKQVMQVVDQPDGTGLACNPFDSTNARAVKNRIALVDRGACGFTVKVKNAQDAGADAVIVVDNVAGDPPADLGGADPTITIPAVRVSLATGNRIKAALGHNPSGRSSNVVGRLDVDGSQLSGADKLGRVMLFSPNPFQPGSSISHWDTSAFRNLLMEPFINADLKHAVKPPDDLTLPMFKDIGW